MQKLGIFLLGMMMILSSCSDTYELPDNPDNGGDGGYIGTTFEVTGNFVSNGIYRPFVFNFNDNGFRPYESDAVLVYILWESQSGDDYWRPVPQSVYLPLDKVLVYNYDYRSNINNNEIYDIEFFLDGNIQPESLDIGFTQNQTFKIVVLPADFLNTKNVDINNFKSIQQADNITLKKVNSTL